MVADGQDMRRQYAGRTKEFCKHLHGGDALFSCAPRRGFRSFMLMRFRRSSGARFYAAFRLDAGFRNAHGYGCTIPADFAMAALSLMPSSHDIDIAGISCYFAVLNGAPRRRGDISRAGRQMIDACAFAPKAPPPTRHAGRLKDKLHGACRLRRFFACFNTASAPRAERQ